MAALHRLVRDPAEARSPTASLAVPAKDDKIEPVFSGVLTDHMSGSVPAVHQHASAEPDGGCPRLLAQVLESRLRQLSDSGLSAIAFLVRLGHCILQQHSHGDHVTAVATSQLGRDAEGRNRVRRAVPGDKHAPEGADHQLSRSIGTAACKQPAAS